MLLRHATENELPAIWEIIKQAIEQRRLEGSQQWQDGYPNYDSIKSDFEKNQAFVLISNNNLIAYAAIIFDIEPAYTDIEGKWLTHQDYVVVHRVAVSANMKRKGIAKKLFQLIEPLAIQYNIFSIRVDTNYDNIPMLKILHALEYQYCGEVYFRGSARKAFEKVLQ